MSPVLRMAGNFLREHRWPALLLFGWIALLALASADLGRQRAIPGDVEFYIVQQAIFICVFSAFLAADAIHNDRKSKRILLVLSKAITRPEYLLAPLLGTSVAAIAYALLFDVCCLWLTDRAHVAGAAIWPLTLLVIAGSILAAAVALFFSTFLNPYVAIAATVLLFTGPGSLHLQHNGWSAWMPGFPILLAMIDLKLTPDATIQWKAISIAMAQSVIFWMMAAAVFNRRDIAVPVE
jgi:ABC-type Na+ efflux pump permease subunit